MNTKTLSVISGVLLFLAIPSGWPYIFYILLRWWICISSIIVAIDYYNSKLNGWMMVFGGIAFLFNPLIPIYLNKSSWVSIDLIVAIIFLLSAFSENRKINIK